MRPLSADPGHADARRRRGAQCAGIIAKPHPARVSAVTAMFRGRQANINPDLVSSVFALTLSSNCNAVTAPSRRRRGHPIGHVSAPSGP
jgi:hypothetical protein